MNIENAVFIALGANLPSMFGKPHQTLAWAVQQLAAHNIKIIKTSSLYLTEPVPASNQPFYTNQIVQVETSLGPDELMQKLLNIEVEAGRVRFEPNAMRCLDLDIIAFGNETHSSTHVQLPHPRMHQRLFVLKPLNEIAPHWVHPTFNKTVQELIKTADDYACVKLSHIPQIMGVLNVTPDSFSDGGQFAAQNAALIHAQKMVDDGADIIDIGGESTRPNAPLIPPTEEQNRIIPILKQLVPLAHKHGRTISVDTRNASTMRAALEIGVDIINDVTALHHDKNSIHVLKNCNCDIVLMHMRGTPATMQSLTNYKDIVREVYEYYEERLNFCAQHNIAATRITLDFGLGFAKTAAQNIVLLEHLPHFQALGCKLLIGASRKSMIPRLTGECEAHQRIGGSIQLALYAQKQGAHIIRIHDVQETLQAIVLNSYINS